MELTEAGLRGFLGDLVAALDTWEYGYISIDDVERQIDAGDLVPYLASTLGTDADFSLLTPEACSELNAKYLDLWQGNYRREGRKWGIHKSGLCLLVAWGLTILGHFDLYGADTPHATHSDTGAPPLDLANGH
jgi:hypothetical protein